MTNYFILSLMSTTREQRVEEVVFQQAIRHCIQSVSPTNKYQFKLMAFFTLVAFAMTLQVFSSMLFYMNPVFLCAESPTKIYEDDACPQLLFCSITNTETITAELQLYCDSRKSERILLQSGLGIGCLLGLILAAGGDRLGKKFCLYLGLLLLNLTWIFQFVGVHYRSMTLLFLGEIISGIANKVVYVGFIVLLTRFMKRDGYELGTLIWYITYHGMGQTALSALNAAFQDWRTIAYVYSACIAFCSIAALFILKEDPVFLFDVGRIDQTKRILEDIGRENGATTDAVQLSLRRIDELFQEKMNRMESGLRREGDFNLRQIFRWDIMQAVVIIGLAGASYQLGGQSMGLTIQNMEYSYNFNLLLLGLSGICGFLSAIYVNGVEPQRKRGLIASSLLYGLLAMLFLFPFCYQSGEVETVVIFLLRVLLCWSGNFFTRLKVDSFPQRYQMTIIGLIEFICTIGLVLSPTVVQASIDRNINPIVSVNILRIVIGTLPLFLHTQQRIQLKQDESQPSDDPKEKRVVDALE